jgi:hypothetical protein
MVRKDGERLAVLEGDVSPPYSFFRGISPIYPRSEQMSQHRPHTTMGDQSIRAKAKALLLPANGSEVKLVGYNVMERENGDGNANADFYDPIPDLRPWLSDAFQERVMVTFYIDVKEQYNYDTVTRTFIKADDSTSYGRYCLYYTLSSHTTT